MSVPKNKGKQISVIIAGATGSTGRHLVSRLVSHPDVSRVVALVRRPVPVNRWTTVFPQLNTSDALRCLSVVPLDWEKMINDVSKIPLSYVAEGVWDYNAERGLRSAAHRTMSWHQYQQLRRLRSGADATSPGAPVATSHFPAFVRQLLGARHEGQASRLGGHKAGGFPYAPPAFGRTRGTLPRKRVGYVQFTHYSSPAAAANGDGEGDEGEDNVESDIMTVGVGRSGLLGFSKTGLETSGKGSSKASSASSSSASSAASTSWSSALQDPFYDVMSDDERIRYGKAFLQQMLQTPFYQTIFTGHHVAINCIGTSHWLSSRYLAAVDYDLSITFAKAVRIFNCMTHAEVNEMEDELLMEQANQTMDSVLWKEIYSACYGKKIEAVLPGALDGEATANADGAAPTSSSLPEAPTDLSVNAETAALSLDDTDGEVSSPLNNFRARPASTVATTAGAATLHMMDDPSLDGKMVPDPLSGGLGGVDMGNMVPPLNVISAEATATLGPNPSTGDKDFMRNLTTYGAVATLRHFTQMSVRAANPNSLVPYLCVHGQRDKELLFMFNQAAPKSRGVSLLRPFFSFIDPFFKVQDEITVTRQAPESPRGRLYTLFFGSGTSSSRYASMRRAKRQAEEANLPDSEKVAVERLQMLLRRDRVKVWELADLTIWRPGVFRRRARQRWLERLFTLVERPVDINLLAECVVDDIIEGIARERSPGEPHNGTVKVINGQSVSRRVHMKAIEDGLDERDAKHGSSLGSEPLLRLPARLLLVALCAFFVWFVYVAYQVAARN